MDTLFTTFLSPGMAPSAWPLQDTLLGNCLVDVTNWSSNISELIDNHLNVVSGDQFVEGLTKKKGSDCWNQHSDMYIETPYIMYFQSFPDPCSFNSPQLKRKVSDSSFNDYFRHQIHHIAVNRRMQTTLQATFNCCLQFGTSDCSLREESNHCCCSKVECCKMAAEKDTKSAEACPCDEQANGDRYCDSHELFIQDMETNGRSCTWNIYFGSVVVQDEQDDYFVNPCYNELCENLLDDSFEIEFATTTADEMESSFDSIDFANLHLPCDGFDGGGDENFDIYDEDEDCDVFDEAGLCEIFNSELHISPTWSNQIIISRTSSRQLNLPRCKRDYISTNRVASLYHTQCTSSNTRSSVVADNKKRTGNVNLTDGKVKKKVHFPEPERLVTVHRLVAWAHAYKESRKSVWSKFAQDRAHFRRRIMKLSDIIEPVLKQKVSQFDKKS